MWSDTRGEFVAVDPADRVHVWVFALNTAEDPERYDPFSLSQWEFCVMPHCQLRAANQTSARVSFFESLDIRPVSYDELQAAAAIARRQNDEDHG